MYRRVAQGWLKYLDFIIADEIALQIAFGLPYLLRQHAWIPYSNELYREVTILLAIFDLLVAVLMNSMHNAVNRGYCKEITQTILHCLVVYLLTVLWMLSLHKMDAQSCLVLFTTFVFHCILGYGARILLKWLIRKNGKCGELAMLAVLDVENAQTMVDRLQCNQTDGYHLTGVVLANADSEINRDLLKEWTVDKEGRIVISGIPVVCSVKEAPDYICRRWIDSVYVSCQRNRQEIRDLMGKCGEMGVTVFDQIPNSGQDGLKQFSEEIGGSTVITSCMNFASPMQLAIKRGIDLLGGVIGSLIALMILAVVGPMIRKASPGPILYKSERIGQNGKPFRMLKIRSMCLDADEKKSTFIDQNRFKDGLMFKLDFDPRVIGNKELPDGTKKTGIGDFIRRTNLDEFPQFFNVLKGDMSLVGTRPPTPDEWEKYEYHHRARLATKPGITGMWQVSGRSEITDFEEVVKLDTGYIRNWSLGLDIKILLLTIKNVLMRKGAM